MSLAKDRDLPRVKGVINHGFVIWTCPECGGVNNSHINETVRAFEKRKNLDTNHKKLCQQCPKGTKTWIMVESED